MNKVIIRYTSGFFCLLLFFISSIPLQAQTVLNKHGLLVINKVNHFRETLHDKNKAMTDVRQIPGIAVELIYATSDNFMKIPLYPPTKTSYLRKPAIDALKKVQKELNTGGLGIKIWDAYRPYSVTEKMWEPVKDERYVANPASGSGHNRGISVDLTLIDITTKKEINMGTGFDHFSDTAHTNFKGLPEEVLKNRQKLISIMERNGFIALETEWWHFYLPEGKKYELLDLSFKNLAKINRKFISKPTY